MKLMVFCLFVFVFVLVFVLFVCLFFAKRVRNKSI